MIYTDIQPVDLVERIPNKKIDHKRVSNYLLENISKLENEKQTWISQNLHLLDRHSFIYTSQKQAENGDSVFHVPITFAHTKSAYATLLNALFGVRPWFVIKPLEWLDKKRIELIGKTMHWAIVNYVNNYKGIYQPVRDWVWDGCTFGWSTLKLRWDNIIRKSIIVEEVPLGMDMSEEEIEELSTRISMTEETGDIKYIAREVEGFIKVFEGPFLETISPEDIFFPSTFSDISDLNLPHFVAHRTYMSPHEIKVKGKQKLFDSSAVEEILKKEPDSDYIDSYSIEMKRKKAEYKGISYHDMVKEKRFVVDEMYCRYDIDEDGYDEEVIFWFNKSTSKILRWTYLDRISPSPEPNRNLYKWDYNIIPREAYSAGIPEIARSCNDELDSIHNMRMNFGMLSNNPTILATPTSGLKKENIRLGYNQVLWVEDVNQVRVLQFPNSTAWGFQEENLVRSYVDMVTSINPISMGMTPNPVGSASTATGTAILNQNTSLQLDPNIKNLQLSFSSLLRGIHKMLEQKLPPETMIRVMGANGVDEIDENGNPVMKMINTKEEISGKLDFELIANMSNMNRNIEIQQAQQILADARNPVDLQTGISQAINIYNAKKNLYQKMGIINPDEFVSKPETAPTALTLQQEIASIIQGIQPSIIMNDDHQSKIDGLSRYFEDDRFNSKFMSGAYGVDPSQFYTIYKLYEDTVNAHRRMLESIQVQSQNPNLYSLGIPATPETKASGMVNPQTNLPVSESPLGQNTSTAPQNGSNNMTNAAL